MKDYLLKINFASSVKLIDSYSHLGEGYWVY